MPPEPIDAAILSVAKGRSQKVAMVIVKTANQSGDHLPHGDKGIT